MAPTYRVVLSFPDTAVPSKILSTGLTRDEADDMARRTAESLGPVGDWLIYTDTEE